MLNVTTVRFDVALNYFVMRLLSPFGLFRAKGTSSSGGEEVSGLRENGIVEIRGVEKDKRDSLITFFCERVAGKDGKKFNTLPDYFDYYRREKIQRPTGLFATGRGDCAITNFVMNDYLIDIASRYLGLDRKNIVAQANIDALIRVEGARVKLTNYDDALEFHRDIDSYKFLKMFVYLTDCFQGDGHHEVYLGSHRYTPLSLGPIARYTNAEVERAIPQARIHFVEGRAGYAFAEDTFAFHRGTKPRTGDRLILNIEFMESTFASLYERTFPVWSAGRGDWSRPPLTSDL